MNIILLVISVVSAFFIYKMAASLIARLLPKTLWAKPLYTLPGLCVGGVYIYFAGYYVMDKDAALPMSLIIALAPWVAYIAWKVITRARLIEE